MKCPIDSEKLVITERQGIEIDYCSECRGIWLDRGELDKLIERSNAILPNSNVQYQPKGGHESSNDGLKKKKKREGFLGDLFDF